MTRPATLLFALLVSLAPLGAADPFQLQRGDVVAFLGGTNMVRLQRAGHLEAILTDAFAEARPRFRDLAWEADTIARQGTVVERWRRDGYRTAKGFGDLDAQLRRIGATVVVAQFGTMEVFERSTDFRRELDWHTRVREFERNYAAWVDSVLERTRTVVLVSPVRFETPMGEHVPAPSSRNERLAAYVAAIRRIAVARELPFVDLSAIPDGEAVRLTDNGLHVRDASQRVVAERIATQLGLDVPKPAALEPLRLAVVEKHRLWSDYWRPANWKLLFGDDAFRQFTKASEGHVTLREEWQRLLPLVARAEDRVFAIAAGRPDPGPGRPEPEVLHADPRADVAAELASFTVPEGFRVNLFASEEHGLTSPLNLRWDPAGRMYVTVTTTYPHVRPGDVPNDKVILLEDRDHDGTADRSTDFAEGLNIPTGLEWGDGGLYVGQNTDLLFLCDTDGDRVADERRVLLSGFGNGDSHQTINSFVWSPDGELVFGHGDGCESRVETPWGPVGLFNAGYLRLRPRRGRLLPFLEGHMAAGNPWGVAYDDWGQPFGVDGAGGVTWLTPGLVDTTHRRRLDRIGQPGGYCGIAHLDGRHLPESMHGEFAVGDFKANRVKRFALEPDGSGFRLEWREPLLHSRHRNFRPVDVKVGPDGAVYVVDWYNPITCHQDDAFRDPTRDKAHGRIWRISRDDVPPVEPPELAGAAVNEVVAALAAPERWTRYHAKRELTTRDTDEVSAAIDAWVRTLDAKHPRYEHHLYEALAVAATLEIVKPVPLRRLLAARDPRARAFATRIAGRWYERLGTRRENPAVEWLWNRAEDEHPRVRLEALIASLAIPESSSVPVLTAALDHPRDRWIDYAFGQAAHRWWNDWEWAYRAGIARVPARHQAALLNAIGGRELLDDLRRVARDRSTTDVARFAAIDAVLAAGGPEDVAEFALAVEPFVVDDVHDARRHGEVLGQLVEVARSRGLHPADDDLPRLAPLVDHVAMEIRIPAIELAGAWGATSLAAAVRSAATNAEQSLAVRRVALLALAEMKADGAAELVRRYALPPHGTTIRSAAIAALVRVDASAAATLAARFLAEDAAASVAGPEADVESGPIAEVTRAFLDRAEGAQALAAGLTRRPPPVAVARTLLRAMFAAGRSDRVLFDVLNGVLGEANPIPEFNPEFVAALVTEVRETGNADRGRQLFDTMACASCHRVAGRGGSIGPDLTAIGTTLSRERIVEEVLWPGRKVKEGYTQVVVVTTRGRVHTGYERAGRESDPADDLVLVDPATGRTVSIPRAEIDEHRVIGTPMPAGLAAILTRPQLRDLLRYVSDLGRLE